MINQNSNQWMLFGVDVRSLGQLWLDAWRGLLFSYQSPVRERLDEPVLLRRGNGVQWFQGGREIGGSHVAGAEVSQAGPVALEVPESLVLVRRVSIPVAAESELLSILQLEVSAASPFQPGDTVHGWEEVSRDAQSVVIALAIASRSGIDDWLHGAGRSDDNVRKEPAPEVWADLDGVKICLRGFGEATRERMYRRRLLRVSVIIAAALCFFIAIAGLFALDQRLALGKLKSEQVALQSDAAEVSALRESLVQANEIIRSSNELISQYPNPHLELARLTRILGDDAFVTHFSMRGRELRIRGRAAGAAAVMQSLAEADSYAAVTAPQAITAVRDTGLEQFHLDIDLAPPAATGSAASAEEGGL